MPASKSVHSHTSDYLSGHPASSSRKLHPDSLWYSLWYTEITEVPLQAEKKKTLQPNCSRKNYPWFNQMGKPVHCEGSVDFLQHIPTAKTPPMLPALTHVTSTGPAVEHDWSCFLNNNLAINTLASPTLASALHASWV